MRRAKLYYLRDRTGKSARIAEKIRKKIGVDIDVKPETVNEDNLAPTKNLQENEKKLELAPKTDVKKEEASKAEKSVKTEQKLENKPEKK